MNLQILTNPGLNSRKMAFDQIIKKRKPLSAFRILEASLKSQIFMEKDLILFGKTPMDDLVF